MACISEDWLREAEKQLVAQGSRVAIGQGRLAIKTKTWYPDQSRDSDQVIIHWSKASKDNIADKEKKAEKKMYPTVFSSL
jgi:hypothetical protein